MSTVKPNIGEVLRDIRADVKQVAKDIDDAHSGSPLDDALRSWSRRLFVDVSPTDDVHQLAREILSLLGLELAVAGSGGSAPPGGGFQRAVVRLLAALSGHELAEPGHADSFAHRFPNLRKKGTELYDKLRDIVPNAASNSRGDDGGPPVTKRPAQGSKPMSVGSILIATLALIALSLAWAWRRRKQYDQTSRPRTPAANQARCTLALVVSASAEPVVMRLRNAGILSQQLLMDLAPHVEFVGRRPGEVLASAFSSGRLPDAPGEYDRFVVVFDSGADIPALSASATSFARQEALDRLVGRRCTVTDRLASDAIENQDFFRF